MIEGSNRTVKTCELRSKRTFWQSYKIRNLQSIPPLGPKNPMFATHPHIPPIAKVLKYFVLGNLQTSKISVLKSNESTSLIVNTSGNWEFRNILCARLESKSLVFPLCKGITINFIKIIDRGSSTISYLFYVSLTIRGALVHE